jgi:hypothetical protein
MATKWKGINHQWVSEFVTHRLFSEEAVLKINETHRL